MGNFRFIWDNKITSSTMLRDGGFGVPGQITAAIKDGSGNAVLTPSGTFTGPRDVEYVVEIDNTAAGVEVGQAKFKWSDSGGATWNATGVTTTNVRTTLSNSVGASFTSAAGTDCALGDRWYFKAYNVFGLHNLIDGDPDSRYKSTTLNPAISGGNPIYVELTSGGPSLNSFAMYKHNLSSNATVIVYVSSSSGFSVTTAVTAIAVSSNSDKLLHYFTTPATNRYWAFIINDTANTDGAIEIGELVLSTYTELSANQAAGASRPYQFFEDKTYTPHGAAKNRYYNHGRTFSYSFPAMTTADVAKVENMIDAITDKDLGTKKRIIINEDSCNLSDHYLVDVDAVNVTRSRDALGRYDLDFSFSEVVKTGT